MRQLLTRFTTSLSVGSVAMGAGFAATAGAQEVLPFPPTPSASVAGRTMEESIHKRRVEPRRLPKGAPNIIIVLLDDAGPGLPTTYGGEVNTPTLDRVAKAGISYNRFHTTAMSSPTRAALLTGRNAHRVGSGQITELANDWDGYSGVIPKSSATVAEVLKNYGYSTVAFGKWHNTPANQTSPAGPFENWPAGYGFEYFYGFLGGEASHYQPNLVRNTSYVPPPRTPEEGYHLTEDLADDAIDWMRKHKTYDPVKPFFMYWASGAVHSPLHVPKEYIDKYKGKFDDGWDNYRERTFKRAREMGWIPANAQLTPRHPTMASWDSIPEDEKPFQRRLMETFAGFAEHTDRQVGRIVDEVEKLGYGDNTLIFYIWGDNGSSAEGQNGVISELLVHNGIPTKASQHIKALDSLGGLDAIGTRKTNSHYNAGWAWAASTPYKGTKLTASYFGGTRNPLAVSWPAKIRHDGKTRSQFTHVNDVTPTIYELTGITAPRIVNGVPQNTIDGISFAGSFGDANVKSRKLTQYFEILGSRAIYHDGWMASTIGPRIPWIPGIPAGIREWTPDKDVWELYNLNEDWSQANDLAAKMPEKLAQMKEIFAIEAAKNSVLPIGGALYVLPLHPAEMIDSGRTEWNLTSDITRMPEMTAPRLGSRPNLVTVDAEAPANANGVLYKLGAFAGGLTAYVKEGSLCYEYNLFEINRTNFCSKEKLPAGRARIEVETVFPSPKPGSPADVTMKVNGALFAKGTVPLTAPLLFSANDWLDVGTDLGTPVSPDYFDKAPFAFNGKIDKVNVKYLR